jgi:hypothetical protein
MCKFKLQIHLPTIASICWSIGAANAGEALKSSEFLKYSDSAQDSYITIAAGMAGVVATQNDGAQAGCIDQWVVAERSKGYQPVLQAMRQYPDYHPHAVIIAVLQKACGSFKYVK